MIGYLALVAKYVYEQAMKNYNPDFDTKKTYSDGDFVNHKIIFLDKFKVYSLVKLASNLGHYSSNFRN